MSILSDFNANVLARINRSDSDASTRANIWLVETFKAICVEYPFVELRAKTTGTTAAVIASTNKKTFALSALVRAIQCVTITDPDILNADGTYYTVRLHPTGFRQLAGNTYSSTRRPSRYARFDGANLWLDSVPDKDDYTISVYAWMYPTIHATPASTVVVTPMEWDEIITWAATWRGLQEHLRYDEASLLLKNTIMPILSPKVNNMKQYLELQDWDTPLAIVQPRYMPSI